MWRVSVNPQAHHVYFSRVVFCVQDISPIYMLHIYVHQYSAMYSVSVHRVTRKTTSASFADDGHPLYENLLFRKCVRNDAASRGTIVHPNTKFLVKQ